MVSAILGALFFGLVAATPTPAKTSAATSCTFTDAAKASASKAACSTIILKDVAVPAGTTLDMTNLNNGTKVIFQGTTTFGYKEWKGPLISVSGSDLAISGDPGHLIDGNGPAWWDGKGSNGGKTKPKFFAVHSVYQSTLSNLNVKNTPVQGFSINMAANVVVDHITIDNSAGDVENGGHNTDAFNVGQSSGITISNANIKNQDDCLAINSGSNIHFVGGSCVGGHGLSIGSVGGRSNNDVDGVVIENSLIANSQNGVRIKTVYDATGSVNNVTYSNIKLQNITKYGIVLEQDYENGSPTGTPTTGVPITDLTLDGVTGTVDKSGTNIYILCGEGSCSDWTWKNVSVTGGQENKTCSNIPSGASC